MDIFKPILEKEQKLVRALRRGEETAFKQVVGRLYRSMVLTALRHVSDFETAEEVAQDTWLAVLDSIHRFEGRSSVKTWIFGILLHKAKDRGIRERRYVPFTDYQLGMADDERLDPLSFHQQEQRADCLLPPLSCNTQTPEQLMARREAVEIMNRAIETLPSTLKEVLVLCDVEGRKSGEISDLLGISRTNSYVRLHRARARIRRALSASLEIDRCPV